MAPIKLGRTVSRHASVNPKPKFVKNRTFSKWLAQHCRCSMYEVLGQKAVFKELVAAAVVKREKGHGNTSSGFRVSGFRV